MIGQLLGRLEDKRPDLILVDVGDVGGVGCLVGGAACNLRGATMGLRAAVVSIGANLSRLRLGE
jgi:hypothetical protein